MLHQTERNYEQYIPYLIIVEAYSSLERHIELEIQTYLEESYCQLSIVLFYQSEEYRALRLQHNLYH